MKSDKKGLRSLMRRTGLLCALLVTTGGWVVAGNTVDSTAQKTPIYTGWSGGMMVHVGYLFAPDAGALFGNAALANTADLPRGGVTAGIGGAMKIRLIDHIHIGGEGFVSTMPLMKNNSQVRTGWGGLLLDYYWTKDRFLPFVGFTIGGGGMRRLYEPRDGETGEGESGMIYNTSFRKTTFMFVGPYVGFEYALTLRVALVCRMDYVVPLGRQYEHSTDMAYLSPAGPRLYVGFMFSHKHKK